jgi:ubiquinone/menaquinone biosynthesis C-methylase UbiE
LNYRVLRDVMRKYPLKTWLISYLSDIAYAEYRDKKKFIKGRLIDIGCGDKPYKDFWAPVVSEYVGIDHEATLHNKEGIEILCSAYKIPQEAESFDSAICNAVLEHLEEPEAALRECYRLLKPGGFAIYSVPFIWHLHEEPRDFFRYSKYGLKYLFEKVGFEIIEIKPLSGFWVTFGQLLVYNLFRFNDGLFSRLRLIDGLALIVQIVSYTLDRIDRTEQWTWMYLTVGRKPARTLT